jgi:diguanylate cyclase (GGDEF)-like protein
VSSLSFNNDNYGLLITDHPFTRLADIDYISSQLGASIFITNMLEHLNMTSITDELTSIYNRRGIQKQIRIIINNLKENEYAYVVFIDLDKLKEINDRYGHESGDCAIIMASKILLEAFPDDIVGRVGGDEFLVVIKPDHMKIIKHIDDRIEAATKALEKEYQYPFTVSLSYGISILDYYTDEHTIKDVIDAADNFMYERKRKRRSKS